MRSDCYVWQDGQLRPLTSTVPIHSPGAKKTPLWKGLSFRLMSFFSGSAEPQIRQRTYGDQLIWHVYDPRTEQRWQFTSEQEVRVWLEQRYHGF